MRMYLALFALLSLIWGSTWYAGKIALEAVPPFFLSGLRFLIAGGILLILAQGRPFNIKRHHWRSIFLTALLMIALPFGSVFWGLQHLDTGVAALLNFGVMPLSLYVLSAALGVEQWTLKNNIGVLLGLGALVVLFWARIQVAFEAAALIAMGILSLVTLASAYGAILQRQTLSGIDIFGLSAFQLIIGGSLQVGLSLFTENISFQTAANLLQAPTLWSFLNLIVFSSIFAFTIYIQLVRVWKPSHVGMYAFISPVVAVILGVTFLGEVLKTPEYVAMFALLSAVILVLSQKRGEPAEDAVYLKSTQEPGEG